MFRGFGQGRLSKSETEGVDSVATMSSPFVARVQHLNNQETKPEYRQGKMPFSLDLLRTNSIPSPYLGRFMFGFRWRNPNMKRPRYGDGTAQIRRWVGVKGESSAISPRRSRRRWQRAARGVGVFRLPPVGKSPVGAGISGRSRGDLSDWQPPRSRLSAPWALAQGLLGVLVVRTVWVCRV